VTGVGASLPKLDDCGGRRGHDGRAGVTYGEACTVGVTQDLLVCQRDVTAPHPDRAPPVALADRA